MANLRQTMRRWSAEELAELALIAPRRRGAVHEFARKWGRSATAASTKLAWLRLRGRARDTYHVGGKR